MNSWLGPGVVFDGTLGAFSGRFAKATRDPGSWAPGVTRAYEFTVTLTSLPTNRRGLGATARFEWKARGN